MKPTHFADLRQRYLSPRLFGRILQTVLNMCVNFQPSTPKKSGTVFLQKKSQWFVIVKNL